MQYAQRLELVSTNTANRWDTLLSSKVLGPTLSDTFIVVTASFLSKHYVEQEWRRYHTFFHLERMFIEFDKVRDELLHPECVEFAIFLHDIIYVIGRKDNEAKSAKVAKHWLALMGANKFTVRRMMRLITVGTKHTRSPKARLTNDEKYMSDLDLYGFSLSYDTVLGQSRDVRREFSQFSDEEFRKSHGNFLASMLTRRIYLTDHFSQYEMAARENIQRVLQNMDQVAMARPTDKRS